MDDFKKMWATWGLGNQIIFVAGCVSVFSMLLSWVDVGIASQNGFSQGAFLLLGFYVYPLMQLFKNKDINKLWGRVCSIGTLICSLVYISSNTITMFDQSVNVSSTGAYIFLLASIAFIVGVEKYSVTNKEN